MTTATIDAARESAAEKLAMLSEARQSGNGKVTFVELKVGQERHRFQIGFNEFCDMELQLSSPVQPVALYRRVVTGEATAREIGAIIRAGLVGGGATTVGPIVDRILEDRPLGECIALAETILAAALVGVAPPKEA